MGEGWCFMNYLCSCVLCIALMVSLGDLYGATSLESPGPEDDYKGYKGAKAIEEWEKDRDYLKTSAQIATIVFVVLGFISIFTLFVYPKSCKKAKVSNGNKSNGKSSSEVLVS